MKRSESYNDVETDAGETERWKNSNTGHQRMQDLATEGS